MKYKEKNTGHISYKEIDKYVSICYSKHIDSMLIICMHKVGALFNEYGMYFTYELRTWYYLWILIDLCNRQCIADILIVEVYNYVQE